MKTDLNPLEPDSKQSAKPVKWLFYPGALALLSAMGVDAVAVLGRHVGLPLPGSIELVRAAILVAASVAMISATLSDKHAKVRFLTDRLKTGPQVLLKRIQTLLCAVFFCFLTTGSFWIFLDLWGGHEESEVLRIPYSPLRIICILAALAVALSFLKRLTAKEAPSS